MADQDDSSHASDPAASVDPRSPDDTLEIVDLPAEAQIYFESLAPVYDEIREWLKGGRSRERPKWRRWASALGNVLIVLAAICIFPIVSLALTWLMPPVNIGPFELGGGTLGSFAVLWLATGVVGVCLLATLIWISDRLPSSDPAPPHVLSPEQLSFVACYNASRELTYFFASHLEKHLEETRRQAGHLLSAYAYFPWEVHMVTEHGPRRNEDFDRRAIVFMDEIASRQGALHPGFSNLLMILGSVLRVSDRAPWIGLDDEVKGRIRSFVDLGPRVIPRLRTREDLPAVSSILNKLTSILFAYLPEHAVHMPQARVLAFHSAASPLVAEVVDLVASLGPTEEPPQDPPPMGIRGKLHAILWADTPEASFLRWCVALLVAAAIGTALLRAVFEVEPQVGALVITSSIVAAAGIAQLSRGRRR